ncbi:MAG: TolC family protein [Nitrospirae bacterium]|nr:TolC family protein [Nitrospirota bacterium]MBF0542280.1 TolC family protein [Nitrospirota bacterium]
MKIILISILILLISSVSVFGEGINNPRVVELVSSALANNPILKAASASINSSQAMESVESSFNDPKIEFGIDSMSTKMFSLSQEFPFFGKLSLKGDIAHVDTKLSTSTFIDAKNSLIMDVKLAYLQIEFIDRSIELTEKNRQLLKKLVSIAETKYAVGNGLQQDVLKAQLELSSTLNSQGILKHDRITAVARLNTLLYKELISDSFEVTQPLTMTPFDKTFEEIKALAVDNSTVLSSAKLENEKAKLKRDLAQKDYYPDFMLKFSYTTSNPIISDYFTAIIGVSIPLWFSKQKNEVNSAEFEIESSMQRYNAALNNVSYKISELLSIIDRSKEQIELYKNGIIPQAELSLNSAVSGYQVNNIDFLTMSSAQSELYKYQIDYNEFIKEHEAAIAELSAIVGLELPFEGSAPKPPQRDSSL